MFMRVLGLVICGVAAFVTKSPGTSAGDVADVVARLYGGEINLAPVAGHAPHFAVTSESGLSDLSKLISSTAGIQGINAPVASITFDLEEGIPVQQRGSLGPIKSERADTLGEGILDLALAYSHIEYTTFEGTDLDDLVLRFDHDSNCPVCQDDFILVDVGLDIKQDIVSLGGLYGVTNNLDLGAVVPIYYTQAKATASATIFDPNGDTPAGVHIFSAAAEDPSPIDSVEDDALALGDILLRGKYNLNEAIGRPREELGVAALGQLTTPTGDRDDLAGEGRTAVMAMAVVSKQFGWVGPHVNFGYEYVFGPSELNNLRYAVGADMELSDDVAAVIDVFGRYHPSDDDGLRDLVDLSVGLKWAPNDTSILSIGAIVPINKSTGLRPDVIFGIGGELIF
jgi:hypothetical protein